MRYGREFWQRLAREVDGGGTVADVARRHQVQPRTLSWWRWKLKTATRTKPLLLPVVVRPSAADSTLERAIEVCVDDLIVRVPIGTDVAYVTRLIAALRA